MPTKPITHDALTQHLSRLAPQLRAYVERRIPAVFRALISPDDVLQETWTAAYRSAGRFEPIADGAIDRWIYRIAEQRLLLALRHLRRQKRGGNVGHVSGYVPDSSYLDLFSRLSSPGRTPSSVAASQEAIRTMRSALDSLDEDQRRAVSLHHLEGLTRAEVAEVMDRTKPAVNGLIYRAMDELRKVLRRTRPQD
ncbi:MAG: sigma-70 family RNA polymerase sigma factor [Phycisphaerae bacterium]|nr:sigma-70 family RNA polymerase sigma factor [Phycisphaerae bacterium]